MSKSRICVFCGLEIAPGERAREHVIPQWLLDHLQIREAAITPAHTKPDGTMVSQRSHTLENLQEGRVCGTCNSGWMSTLETQAMPLLIPLFSGGRTVVELTAEDRTTVARWAAKTVFALNSASNYLKTVPPEHFTTIRTEFPPGLAVFGQQHHNTLPFYWLQTSAWHMSVPQHAQLREPPPASYKTTLQFGKLLLLVAHWPLPGWRYGLWPGIHVPLWPHKGPIAGITPASQDFPWHDSIEATAAFHCSLATCHDRSPEIRQFDLQESLKMRKKLLAAKMRKRKQ
jgi:hypothetical protein